jgi:UDP-N-acetylmuramyl pentapeptide synthase
LASLRAGEAAAAAGGRVVAGDPQALLQGAAIDSRTVRGGELFFAFAGTHADGHRFVGDAFSRGAGGAVVQDLEAAAASWPPLAGAAAAPERAAIPAGAGILEGGNPEGAATPAATPAAAAAIPGAAPSAPAVILVADTFAALHDVARSVRRRVPRRLVGITGSAGKTTTKELLAAMLEARYRVARNPGNFNNLYGFPVALLNVPDDTEWMVAEMGMSTPGELRRLSLLGRPDVALFTVVRPAHLQFFDTLRGIAEAKSELLAGLAADGLVVANAGDPEVVRIVRRYQQGRERPEGPASVTGVPGAEGRRVAGAVAGGRRVVWYGIRATAEDAASHEEAAQRSTADATAKGFAPEDGMPAGAAPADPGGPAAWRPRVDVAASDLAPGPGGAGTRFVLWAGGRSQEVLLPLHGLYNVENCLAAAACAFALGVPLTDIAAAAARARPAAGRGVVHRVRGPRGELTVVDDSYNSNPDALEKALESAARLPAARRLAVLGDMLELGPEGPRFHREGGLAAARLGFGPVAGVGELARELVAAARAGGAPASWHPDAAAAADWAAAETREGDLVLVKGSRGVGLDLVVRRLLALGDSGGGEPGDRSRSGESAGDRSGGGEPGDRSGGGESAGDRSGGGESAGDLSGGGAGGAGGGPARRGGEA